MPDMSMMPMAGWMAAWWLVSFLVGAGLLALLVVALVAAIRWLWTNVPAERAQDRALTILRERYARGEINREEFEARRRDLSSG